MGIVKSNLNKKIAIIILVVMLVSMTFPVFATNISEINQGDRVKFTTGEQWNVYNSEKSAKDRNANDLYKKNSKIVYLKKGDEFDVVSKSGNILKIKNDKIDNKYIRYVASNFTKQNQVAVGSVDKSKVPVEEKNGSTVELPNMSLSTVNFSAIGDFIIRIIEIIWQELEPIFTRLTQGITDFSIKSEQKEDIIEEGQKKGSDVVVNENSGTTTNIGTTINTGTTTNTSVGTGNNTISDSKISELGKFIGNFEGGTKTYTINGIACYEAEEDTDNKMRARGVEVSDLKEYGNNYYAKSDVDKKFNETVIVKANTIISKARNRDLKLEENEIMALTSLAFQCSTTSVNEIMDTFKNEGKKAAMEKLLLYTKANGTNRAGLVKRRNAEATLLMEGSYNGKYNNDGQGDLKYYKKVISPGYEFSYSGGPSQISDYTTKYDLVK